MPTNKKIIFGFTGLMVSGKGTAAAYLKEKYSADTFRFSTMLRDLLTRIYLETSRDYMIKMSEIIRGTFGEDTMARVIAKDVERGEGQLIVVEGIRRTADVAYLSKLPNFVLVEIFADPQIRYERLVKRRENPDDATKTFEQFMKDHERSTEISILEITAKATERINNNGSMEEFQAQLDALVHKYCN